MKKVRFVIGAVGVLGAAPALGLLMPAANADAGTHAPATAHTGKTVSLRPLATPAATTALITTSSTVSPSVPAITDTVCRSTGIATAHSGTGENKLTGYADFHTSNNCLRATATSLSHKQAGLLMRTRAYNGTKQVHQDFVHGGIGEFSGITTFHDSSIRVTATKACEALVYSTDKTKVAYGPICEKVS